MREPVGRGPAGREAEGSSPQTAEPLLVLGPEVPAVEDTTPAELARQQEELRRQQEELSQRQEDLLRRQRAVERGERRARRAGRWERRARRAGRGQTGGRLRQDLPARRWLAAAVLAASGAALSAVGGDAALRAGPTTEDVTQFVHADEADVLWQRAALALDAEMVEAAGGRAPAASLASGELARRADHLAPLDSPAAVSAVTEGWPAVLQDAPPDAQVAATWQQSRQAAVGAVGDTQVERARDGLDARPAAGLLTGTLGLLALVGAALLLGSSGVSLAAMLATAGALSAGLLLLLGSVTGNLGELVEDHQRLRAQARSVTDQLGLDLATRLGLHDPATPAETWWTEPPFAVGDLADVDAQAAYTGSRAHLGLTDPQSDDLRTTDLQVRGLALVQDGTRLHEAQTERLAAAREALAQAAARDEADPRVGVTFLTILLPLAALALTRPVRSRPTPDEETR